MLAHLLKYDTAQGRYEGHTVESDETSITVDGKKIEILAEKDPANLPGARSALTLCWSAPASSLPRPNPRPHRRGRQEGRHFRSGRQRPATIVYSVNENTLTAEDTIISAASCTTNCLAPMAKASMTPIPSRAAS